MKESELISMQRKIESSINVLRSVIEEQKHLTMLCAGMMETLKLMPGYEEAIKVMTERALKERDLETKKE